VYDVIIHAILKKTGKAMMNMKKFKLKDVEERFN